MKLRRWLIAFAVFPSTVVQALDLCLPTANDAVLRQDRDAEFFQPTVEGTVESGMFGCVRRDGRRFHEGIDIKCLQRDRAGESVDPVHAVSDGAVAFINKRPGLSNYGRYIVLQHHWDGVQVFTLYAHLRAVAEDLAVGQPVKKGQRIGTLGRSTNTREGISKDRAHLHFEINFMLNPNFRTWYPKRDPKAPPFGNFNGRNFVGIDPATLLRAYSGDRRLNFGRRLAEQPVGFTVLVPARPFPWLAMHPEQIHPAGSTPAAYEIAATSWGLPVAVWPRAAGEITDSQQNTLARGRPVLNLVNDGELARSNCRGMLRRAGRGWEFGERGREWIELLTYTP
jgi:murein DD-endopeptidase MepM/ murein hydrolase activator NlpD